MGSEAKTALIDAINRGQKIVNYTGHGNVNQWRTDLLTNADAGLLTNQNHLAVFYDDDLSQRVFRCPGLEQFGGRADEDGFGRSGGSMGVVGNDDGG